MSMKSKLKLVKENPKVRLMPWTDNVAAYIIPWYENQNNREFFRRCAPSCDWASLEGIRNTFGRLWVIYEDATPVGLAGIFNHDVFSRSCEFGLMIDEKATGNRPFASKEVFKEAAKYIFNYLNVHRLSIKVLPHRCTLVSYLLERGFTLEATLRDSCFLDGEYKDELLYSVLKLEYKEVL